MSKELMMPQQQKLREITLWSQRDNTSAKVVTDVVTWGQLKEQNKHDFNFKNVRGVIRATKNALEIDDAILPTGECLIFLFPVKVSSGMRTKAEYEKTFGSKKLRSMCSERGLGTKGSKAEFAKRLADNDRTGAPKTHKVKPDIVREPTHEAPVTKAEVVAKIVPKETAVAPIPANVGFATVEQATVKTTMKVRINDVTQLGSLLEVMFPGMEVVGIDAMVDLTAELKLSVAIPDTSDVEKPVVEEKPVEKKPVKKFKAPSDADLRKEADAMANAFK